MSADRLSALESLLRTAEAPARVSRGTRARVLQAAVQAHVQRHRRRSLVSGFAAVLLLLAGLTLGIGLLVRQAPPPPQLTHGSFWDVNDGDQLSPPAAGTVSVPFEWGLVDMAAAQREFHNRAFHTGLWD